MLCAKITVHVNSNKEHVPDVFKKMRDLDSKNDKCLKLLITELN